jgi:hypothetical protein
LIVIPITVDLLRESKSNPNILRDGAEKKTKEKVKPRLPHGKLSFTPELTPQPGREGLLLLQGQKIYVDKCISQIHIWQ